jgi:hypothetical protein
MNACGGPQRRMSSVLHEHSSPRRAESCADLRHCHSDSTSLVYDIFNARSNRCEQGSDVTVGRFFKPIKPRCGGDANLGCSLRDINASQHRRPPAGDRQ